MEIIRFGLLLTITVALISVATRHGDDNSSRNQASGGHHPSASPSASATAGHSESPSPAATRSPGGASASGVGGSGSSAGGGNGAAGGASDGGVATLPRTGGTQALELAALAALFIAAGTFGMRLARPASARQAGGTPIERTQPGQAFGSSESNRPGTV
jgi:hypothetical protein